MYRDNYTAEGLQEAFPGAQAFHGVPLTGQFNELLYSLNQKSLKLLMCTSGSQGVPTPASQILLAFNIQIYQ